MRAERLTAQLLAGEPVRDSCAVAERLLAIQAQDARGARLAIRARSTVPRAADVDRALTEDRSLLITWVNRGTLHLVRREDYPLLQLLTTPPQATGNMRRLAQEGVSPDDAERGVTCIVRALEEAGPLTREQLRDRLDAAGVPTAGQALVHLLMLASLRGLIVRGPIVDGRHAFVLVDDWLGPQPAPDRDVALAELARRYLAGHGPSRERDLAVWAGITLGDARTGLRAIAGELHDAGDGLLDLASRAAPADAPARLLGPFDPVLCGWRERSWILRGHTGVVTSNGIFRAIIVAGGRAAGTWSLSGGTPELQPFGRLSRADRAALEADAVAVREFLGDGAVTASP